MIALALAVALAGPQDRSTPAPIDAAPSFSWPAPARDALKNGLKLSVVPLARLPIVAVSIVIPEAGAALDPQGREGLAELLAGMLQEGTRSLPDAAALADAKDELGARISVSAGPDGLTVSVFALKDKLDEALGLAAQMLREPALDARAFERLRETALAGVEMGKTDPEGLAERRLSELVFEGSPYGRSGGEASLRAITLAELQAAHAHRVHPRGAALAAAGDVSPDELKALAEKHFGAWQAPLKSLPVTPGVLTSVPGSIVNTSPSGARIDLIDLPGAQSVLRLGQRLVPRDHPDFDRLLVMNMVLGGALVGRLEANIREAKSWAYYARSRVDAFKSDGAWVVDTQVQADRTGDSLREIIAEIRRLQNEPLSDAELAEAKNFMKGVFLQRNRTVQAIAGQLAAQENLGLPPDALARYNARVDAVTADQVREAARRHLRPDSLHIVVVGGAGEVYSQLAGIAPVRVLDPEGNEKPAPEPKAGAAR